MLSRDLNSLAGAMRTAVQFHGGLTPGFASRAADILDVCARDARRLEALPVPIGARGTPAGAGEMDVERRERGAP